MKGVKKHFCGQTDWGLDDDQLFLSEISWYLKMWLIYSEYFFLFWSHPSLIQCCIQKSDHINWILRKAGSNNCFFKFLSGPPSSRLNLVLKETTWTNTFFSRREKNKLAKLIEDTQVRYISQNYTLEKFTLEKYTLEKNKLWGYTLWRVQPEIGNPSVFF